MIPPPPEHTDRTNLGLVERQQRFRCHLGHGQLVYAERRFDLLRRGRLPDGNQPGDGRVVGDTEHARQTVRRGDALFDDIAEVCAGDAFDELGEHPMSRRRVVLVGAAGLPVEPPAGKGLEPALARVPRRCPERGHGEARQVEHHLLDGDDVLAVRTELGDVVDDALRHVE
jgi:hypothetical protein